MPTPSRAPERAKKTTKTAKTTKTEFKRHQVALDDDRWDWLDGLPGGASKGLRALIDIAREQGLITADDADDTATVLESAANGHEITETGLAESVQPEDHADSLVTIAAAELAAEVVAGPQQIVDPLAYVAGSTFHVPGATVYPMPLGAAVNKKAEHMARVVYEPAHPNPAATGMWQGQGRDYATWIFSEEPGLNERLLESGLELLMDVTLEAGASVGYHVHRRTEEIYYLLAGSLTVGTVAVDGTTHTEVLSAGDAHLVRRGQGHSCEAGAEGARFITVAGRLK
jgi:quercetin dioxygenase-like cupin family protein